MSKRIQVTRSAYCPECGEYRMEMQTVSVMEDNQRIEAPNIPGECPECGSDIVSNKNIVHSDRRWVTVECPYCGIGFDNLDYASNEETFQALKEHVRNMKDSAHQAQHIRRWFRETPEDWKDRSRLPQLKLELVEREDEFSDRIKEELEEKLSE